MIFDNLGRSTPPETAERNEGLNLLHLANSRLDMEHGRLRTERPAPVERRKTEGEILDLMLRVGVQEGEFKGARHSDLEFNVGAKLASSNWDGDAVAAQLNKQLSDAGSPWRVQLDGPHKTQIPQDPKWPGLGSNIYHHLLTVTDVGGNPVKNAAGNPVTAEITYIGDHSKEKQ